MRKLLLGLLTTIVCIPGGFAFEDSNYETLTAKHVTYDSQHRVTSETGETRTEYRYEGKMTIKTSNIPVPDTTVELYTYRGGLCQKAEAIKNGETEWEETFYYSGNVLDSSVVSYRDSSHKLKLYDNKGHLRREVSTNDDDYSYVCDNNGNVLECKSVNYAETATYDSKNRLISAHFKYLQNKGVKEFSVTSSITDLADGWVIHYKGDDMSTYTQKNVVDSKGNSISIEKSKCGLIQEIQHNEYDYDGNKTKVTILRWPTQEQGYDIKSWPIIREHINKSGKVIKTERFNLLMQLTTSCEYTYNAEGQLVKEVWYDRYGKPLRTYVKPAINK